MRIGLIKLAIPIVSIFMIVLANTAVFLEFLAFLVLPVLIVWFIWGWVDMFLIQKATRESNYKKLSDALQQLQ